VPGATRGRGARAGARLFAGLAAKGPSSPGKYNYCVRLVVYFYHSLISKGIMIFSSPLDAGEAAPAISCRGAVGTAPAWEHEGAGSEEGKPLPPLVCDHKGKKK